MTQSPTRTVTIGTRASKLALVQTEMVQQMIRHANPQIDVAIRHITTRGDIILDRPLNLVGGKGLFITEIEDALRRGEVDIAVHSAKDLPTEIPPDMSLVAFPDRADVRDALLSRDGLTLDNLPVGARVGTSSLRRVCQLRALRPDLQITDLRGNVDTRIRKLQEGLYDAIVLAAAGLHRLGLEHVITEYLPPDRMIPAVAQGALAIEIRADDAATASLFASINDPAVASCVRAERAFLHALNGGCTVPVGAHAVLDGERLVLTGMIGAPNGMKVSGSRTGMASRPETLGRRLATFLLAQGGKDLLQEDGLLPHE